MVGSPKATGVPDLQLFLMRHSIAEPTVTTDFRRTLTPDGIRRAEHLVPHLRALNLQPSVVVHSPLVRSQQTAEILANGLGGIPLIELGEVIDASSALLHVLAAGEWQAPLVVGHNPGISILASTLSSGEPPLSFRPASFAAFKVDTLPPKSATLTHWIPRPPAEPEP